MRRGDKNMCEAFCALFRDGKMARKNPAIFTTNLAGVMHLKYFWAALERILGFQRFHNNTKIESSNMCKVNKQ